MRHLLDTHVVVRWLFDDRRLSKEHARLIDRDERAGAPLGIAAISLWEIAKLIELGRLELTLDCLDDIESHALISVVPLTARVAIESTRLGARFPTDPTDQLIGATARCHGLVLLTSDQRIIDAGVVPVA